MVVDPPVHLPTSACLATTTRSPHSPHPRNNRLVVSHRRKITHSKLQVDMGVVCLLDKRLNSSLLHRNDTTKEITTRRSRIIGRTPHSRRHRHKGGRRRGTVVVECRACLLEWAGECKSHPSRRYVQG